MIKMINLKQRVLLRGFREVTVSDKESAKIITKENGSTREFAVPLYKIDGRPHRIKNLSFSYLIALIVFVLLDISFIVSVYLEKGDEEMIGIFGGAAFAIFGAIIYISFRLWITSYDYDIYYDRFIGNPIFTLFRNKPSKQIYDKFKRTFVKILKEIQSEDNRINKTSNNIELIKELEQVGILSNEEKTDIIQRIINQLGQDRVIH